MLGHLRWLLVGALAAVTVVCRAASFGIAPIRVDLSPAKVTAVLTVSNAGDAPAVMQGQVVSWTQHEGRDVYAPTRALIATPPIFTIPAGEKQLVRIGLRRPPRGTKEIAYRIYLQEIPGPPKSGFKGVRIALRFGIPVFVKPANPVKPVMQWTAQVDAGGNLSIALRNTGGEHVQVLDFTLSKPGDPEPLVRDNVPAYVLAGQRMRWPIKSRRRLLHPGETLHLTAQTDSGEIDKDLVVESS